MCLFYFVDSQWILLSADSDGFIPLTFTPTQAVMVRDGSLLRSEVSGESLSQSQDPVSPREVFGDLNTHPWLFFKYFYLL